MTQEQLYWMRRQETLHAYKMQMAQRARVLAAGSGSSVKYVEVKSKDDFKNAFTNIAENEVIKLTSSLEFTSEDESIKVKPGTQAVIELNSKTISVAGDMTFTGTDTDTVFCVQRGGTLVINDSTNSGTIDASASTKLYTALKVTSATDPDDSLTAKLIINGGTFKGTYYAICGNGTRQNTEVIINGGVFEAVTENDSIAVFQPQNGSMTINGGTFKASDIFAIKSGHVVINGGTFNAIGAKQTFKHNPSGWNCTGDCFNIEACDYPGQIPTAEINGGTFISVNGSPVASHTQNGYEDQRVVKFVKGGLFSSELESELIADGFKQVQTSDGKWSVVKAD